MGFEHEKWPKFINIKDVEKTPWNSDSPEDPIKIGLMGNDTFTRRVKSIKDLGLYKNPRNTSQRQCIKSERLW